MSGDRDFEDAQFKLDKNRPNFFRRRKTQIARRERASSVNFLQKISFQIKNFSPENFFDCIFGRPHSCKVQIMDRGKPKLARQAEIVRKSGSISDLSSAGTDIEMN